MLPLAEGHGAILHHRQGHALGVQGAQDVERAVGGAVVEEDVVVDQARVVADERLDDVVLVEDAGDGDDAHGALLRRAVPGRSRRAARQARVPGAVKLHGARVRA